MSSSSRNTGRVAAGGCSASRVIAPMGGFWSDSRWGGKPESGWHVLTSLWETDGALPPMKKPVGKYNVWNKISKSEGTSL